MGGLSCRVDGHGQHEIAGGVDGVGVGDIECRGALGGGGRGLHGDDGGSRAQLLGVHAVDLVAQVVESGLAPLGGRSGDLVVICWGAPHAEAGAARE